MNKRWQTTLDMVVVALVVGVITLELVLLEEERATKKDHATFHDEWVEEVSAVRQERKEVQEMRAEEGEFYEKWVKHQKDMIRREEQRERFFQRWGQALQNPECEATVIEAIKDVEPR